MLLVNTIELARVHEPFHLGTDTLTWFQPPPHIVSGNGAFDSIKSVLEMNSNPQTEKAPKCSAMGAHSNALICQIKTPSVGLVSLDHMLTKRHPHTAITGSCSGERVFAYEIVHCV